MSASQVPSAASPVAVVTGGRRGIGRGIAYALATSGFDIAIVDIERDADAVDTLHAIESHGRKAIFIQADIAAVERHSAVIDAVEKALGSISCLVNNAGVSVATRGDLLEASPESFDRLIHINLRGPFFFTQCVAAKFLAERSPSHYRCIINISSANAFAVSINRGEYCISKSAISMATQLFASRLGDDGIGVFEVRPGIIRTAMTAVAAADYEQRIADGITPIRRWGEPADIGRAVAALASGAFGFSTGDAIHVDGGLHIQRL